jgi:hypothetical protein
MHGSTGVNPINLPVIARSFVAVTGQLDGERIRVTLWGYADMRCQSALGDFLIALDSEATRVHAKEVTVDFRVLDFMNSGCFKHFVRWLATVKQEARTYRITFLSNPEMRWQKLSLRALTCFAPDLATVREPPTGMSA